MPSWKPQGENIDTFRLPAVKKSLNTQFNMWNGRSLFRLKKNEAKGSRLSRFVVFIESFPVLFCSFSSFVPLPVFLCSVWVMMSFSCVGVFFFKKNLFLPFFESSVHLLPISNFFLSFFLHVILVCFEAQFLNFLLSLYQIILIQAHFLIILSLFNLLNVTLRSSEWNKMWKAKT